VQRAPQAPQFSESLARSTQPGPHSTFPLSQTQLAPSHTFVFAQWTPQAPQFSGSLVMSEQSSPQAMVPTRHRHFPEMHA
jgi:hypothetical protein